MIFVFSFSFKFNFVNLIYYGTDYQIIYMIICVIFKLKYFILKPVIFEPEKYKNIPEKTLNIE